MKAMVLAAGRGERMRPITDRIPKPLVPVAGRPLIEYHLLALARAGIRDIVINLAYRGAQIREALADGSRFGVRIEYSDEGPEPLEVGGGIFNALPLLGGGEFIVANADVWTDFDFSTLRPLPPGAHARLVMVPPPPQAPRGDFGLEGEHLTESEHNRCTYSGIGVYSPELFAGCEPGKFPLLPLLKRAIAGGRLLGEMHGGDWSDVGTPQRLEALEETLRKKPSIAGRLGEDPP